MGATGEDIIVATGDAAHVYEPHNGEYLLDMIHPSSYRPIITLIEGWALIQGTVEQFINLRETINMVLMEAGAVDDQGNII